MSAELSKTALGILKVLETHQNTIIGSRELSKQLRVHGIELTERTIRYHMKILDEKGLTQVFGKEGRKITKLGLDELSRAHVSDKVGFINSMIDNLAFKTSFDPETLEGELVLNVSLFAENESKEAMKDRRIKELNQKLQNKNEVVSELMEAHLRLKKSLGEI